jgi:hypothetical protein
MEVKPKLFVSCSFAEKDKEVVKFFSDLAKKSGFQTITARRPEAKVIPAKIHEKLSQCDAIVGIFTTHNKIQDKDEWTVPPSVIYEMGLARQSGKHILGFIEDGVPRDELGIINLEAYEIPPFDRDNLGLKRKDYEEYFKSLIADKPEIKSNYRFKHYTRDLTIYKNGYGISRARCNVAVLSPRFKQVNHWFDMGASAKVNSSLPAFSELKKNDVAARWEEKPFFTFVSLDSVLSGVNESNTRVEADKKDHPAKLSFAIKFDREFNRGNGIDYEWAIGAPGLFAVKKSELRKDQRAVDLPYCESKVRIQSMAYFSYVLRFEKPVQFDKLPQITIYDDGGNPTHLETKFEVQESTLYTVFIAKGLKVQDVPSGSAVVTWTPK